MHFYKVSKAHCLNKCEKNTLEIFILCVISQETMQSHLKKKIFIDSRL